MVLTMFHHIESMPGPRVHCVLHETVQVWHPRHLLRSMTIAYWRLGALFLAALMLLRSSPISEPQLVPARRVRLQARALAGRSAPHREPDRDDGTGRERYAVGLERPGENNLPPPVFVLGPGDHVVLAGAVDGA